MNLLLDTHTFIWWDSDRSRLSARALALCTDPANRLLVSVASAWEIQIKHQLGKLALNRPLEDIILDQQKANQLVIVPLRLEHVSGLSALPSVHRDPFDRVLISTARVEGAALVSKDPVFASYPVPVEW